MRVIAPPPKGAQQEHQRRRGFPVWNMRSSSSPAWAPVLICAD